MRKTRIICILPLFLILVGSCNEDAPLDPVNPSISIPAAQISGVGSDRIGAVEITDGVGYCDIDGDRIPAMVYKAQYWDTYDLTVFHIIAPSNRELHVLYLYSDADTLQTVWHESYAQPLSYESASDTVMYEGQDVLSTPELLCLEAVPEGDQIVSGLTISGSQLNWSSGTGTIEIEDRVYELFPFQMVDCNYCGATANDGWYEVHAVLRGPLGEMEFGILYLKIDVPGLVNLSHRIQISELQLGVRTTYAADWVWEIDSGKREGPLAWRPTGR